METAGIFESSTFIIGCNYWASHAGTAMWSDWRADVVEKDLKRLSEEGLQVLRVFPLWSDFQPLTLLLGGQGKPIEYRHGEKFLSNDEAGNAGVSTDAVEYFEEMAGLAEKYKLKLIVGLITGWMSGRLFVPPAFERKNILTDPAAVSWQIRFVKYFVNHFKDHPAVAAWDLGNECNCMAQVPDRDSAWVWTSSIVNAIRSIDRTHPVLSGMHSLNPEDQWSMQDQGELTDILTTHPYPVFTPYCDRDPANTIRTLLHATAESLFYSGLGGKPCLVEEIGTLGPMIANETVTADFIRTNLFSTWANGMKGLLWWCASDQEKLKHAPYDWYAVERELGLLRSDGTAKPLLKEMGKFGDFLKKLPFRELPDRMIDAICILSNGQDQWGVAYSSMVLAKQAGFDMVFRYESQPLPDAPLYLLPCITGSKVISRRRYMELIEKVAKGATLYISYNGGFVSHFEELTGLRIATREYRYKDMQMLLKIEGQEVKLDLDRDFMLSIELVGAETLVTEHSGNPLFTCARYGMGKVYFLGIPLELILIKRAGSFHDIDAQDYWRFYRQFSADCMGSRIIRKQDPMIGVTEHRLRNGNSVIVMVNYSPEGRQVCFTSEKSLKIDRVIYGSAPELACSGYCVSIGKNDAAVFIVTELQD